ncbi:hypothetical protein AVT06_14375 [Pseudomonas aeruginosa]|nr:hypothetical protein AAY82_19845 [Pseudomonas aeruginosa]KZE30785.1 hypothetical protein AVT06_14375 [Pseudomonas aeruginosa]
MEELSLVFCLHRRTPLQFPHKVNEVLKINIEINRVVGILLVKCNSVQIRVFEELLQVANLCRKSA